MQEREHDQRNKKKGKTHEKKHQGLHFLQIKSGLMDGIEFLRIFLYF